MDRRDLDFLANHVTHYFVDLTSDNIALGENIRYPEIEQQYLASTAALIAVVDIASESRTGLTQKQIPEMHPLRLC